jgi:hypothetical protein
MKFCPLLIASAAALGADQQDEVLLSMKTTFTKELSCNFNSNAKPEGGRCYASAFNSKTNKHIPA